MYLFLSPHDIKMIFPLIVLAAFILLIAISGIWDSRGKLLSDYCISAVAVILAAFFTMRQIDISAVAFSGVFIADNFARAFYFLFFIVALFAVFMSSGSLKRASDEKSANDYVFFLTSLLGMMLTVSAGNIILIFVGMEITALSVSALAGRYIGRDGNKSWKSTYYLAIFLLIVSVVVVYQIAGTGDLFGINEHFISKTEERGVILVGFLLMLPWLLLSLPPLLISHRGNDAYEKMPGAVVWFVMIGPTTAVLAAFFRVLYIALPRLAGEWSGGVASAAVMLMTTGNILVLTQTSLKKMFAFSSVTATGYAMVATSAGGEFGNISLIYFMYAYSFGMAGAFGLLGMLEKTDGSELHAADLAGLERKHPFYSAIMALFLFSLAGMPLTAGFIGLFRIIIAAVKGKLLILSMVMTLNVIVGFFSMIRLIVLMYVYEPREKVKMTLTGIFVPIVVLLSAEAVIVFGAFPRVIEKVLFLLNNCVIYFD